MFDTPSPKYIDQEQLLERAGLEAQQLANYELLFYLPIPAILATVSALQLAMRHPDFPPETLTIVRAVINRCTAQLPDTGATALKELIALGFDPEFDTPLEPPQGAA